MESHINLHVKILLFFTYIHKIKYRGQKNLRHFSFNILITENYLKPQASSEFQEFTKLCQLRFKNFNFSRIRGIKYSLNPL